MGIGPDKEMKLMAVSVSPLRHDDEEVGARGEVGLETDGFGFGVFSGDPPVIPVKLFLHQNGPYPDVLVLETTVLIESFLLLSDGK